jgi:hypothetical protein
VHLWTAPGPEISQVYIYLAREFPPFELAISDIVHHTLIKPSNEGHIAIFFAMINTNGIAIIGT